MSTFVSPINVFHLTTFKMNTMWRGIISLGRMVIKNMKKKKEITVLTIYRVKRLSCIKWNLKKPHAHSYTVVIDFLNSVTPFSVNIENTSNCITCGGSAFWCNTCFCCWSLRTQFNDTSCNVKVKKRQEVFTQRNRAVMKMAALQYKAIILPVKFRHITVGLLLDTAD